MRRIPVLLLATAAALLLASSADAARRIRRPVELVHAHFHRVGTAAYVLTDGRYVLEVPSPAPVPVVGTVIDERTGRKVLVESPGHCGGQPMFGGPWLLVASCFVGGTPASFELYSLADGTYRSVPFNGSFCSALDAQCSVVAVGARWVEVSEGCYHCATSFVFQDLITGAQRGAPTGLGASTVVDLNSPTLTAQLCAPLTVPDPGGVLDFYGRFAVALPSLFDRPAHLERCGSDLYRRIEAPVTGNEHELLWLVPGRHRLIGITLPGLRRFDVRLPRFLPVRQGVSFTLSSNTLYAGANNGMLWSAPAPAAPTHR